MTLRLPLFGRILIWLLLNLIILGVAFGIFLWTELGGESLLGRAAGDRSQAPAGALMAELRDRPIVEWERAMARFEEAYPVRLMLLREDGSLFLGAKLEAKITEGGELVLVDVFDSKVHHSLIIEAFAFFGKKKIVAKECA